MTVSRETDVSTPLDFIAQLGARANFPVQENEAAWGFDGLTQDAAALLLFSFSSLKDRPMMVLCSSSEMAGKLYRSVYNLHQQGVYYFPETSIEQSSVQGFNLESERFQSEVNLALREHFSGIVFTTTVAARTPLRSDSFARKSTWVLSKGERCVRQALVDALINWGYEQTDHTITPKTFSVRGGILDVFLLYAARPIRVEFFGECVSSLRTFNPVSQRKVSSLEKIEILPPPVAGNDPVPHTSLELQLKDTGETVWVFSKGDYFQIASDPSKENLRMVDCRSWEFYKHPRGVREELLASALKPFSSKDVFVFVEGDHPIDRVDPLIPVDFTFVPGSLARGFYSTALGIACVSYSEINRFPTTWRSRWDFKNLPLPEHRPIVRIDTLDWGDALVHRDYGIGLYRGLHTLLSKEGDQECIKIEYADNGAVYVPVEKFDRVHRLVSSAKKPHLSALGTSRWAQQKLKARQTAKTVVQELIDLYAARTRSRGFVYDKNDEFYQMLESSFPYEETPDQRRTIQEVIQDMESDKPMDRLVCGDVGFGKTEVALRAATKAIISGRQVQLLTPTTILADQHYIATRARMDPLGIRVELLSRFKTRKEQKKILEKMHAGEVDLVIGTHRLLSDDVHMPDLGLLIVDEEHRFGVRHKEKIKQLKLSVDVLTLTATPIPRTLQHSLMGIREISRISTPPLSRRPIHTTVRYFHWEAVREAIAQELQRGGQIYFLHNDVLALPFTCEKLVALFPDAVISMAHGQMKSRDLERTILSFFSNAVDILVCTTIIESGLDVSNANTIIVKDAHNFGLSQLYQIRGRVGRSHRQAFCNLFIPAGISLEPRAYQRLKALEQFTSLGAGYDISMKDLEIRGAGSLFGYKQSGHAATVGFELYCSLLKEAADDLLGVEEKSKPPPSIQIQGNALLDAEYIPLVADRLYFYRHLSSAKSVSAVADIREELKDRFGPPPPAAETLLLVARLRVMLTGSSIRSMDISRVQVTAILTDLYPFSSPIVLAETAQAALDPLEAKLGLSPSSGRDLTLVGKTTGTKSIQAVAETIAQLFSDSPHK